MKSNDEDDDREYPSSNGRRPPNTNFLALESVSEIDQYIAAQHLISEIGHQFASNKSLLEKWFITASVEEFKVARPIFLLARFLMFSCFLECSIVIGRNINIGGTSL
jgi:hypothetical protein